MSVDVLVVRKLSDCLRWAGRRCDDRGLPCEITLADLLRLWTKQRGRCALTGVPLEMNGHFGLTLDRINPASYRYHRRNVALVTKRANQAKSDMTMAEFRELCGQVLAQRVSIEPQRIDKP